jgi:phosphatidylserine/phosphatidylglycerophosphate/cardiolipin synthase-like enzyme
MYRDLVCRRRCAGFARFPVAIRIWTLPALPALWYVLILAVLPLPAAAGTPAVYFSPNGGAERALVECLDAARKEINIAVYTFTSRTLAKAVIRAHERGVKVAVILDGNDESDYSKGFYLQRHGVTVRYARGLPLPKKKYRFGLMHNKFAIIDDHTVITGSFNWTASAQCWNRENLLIVDDPVLARRFQEEFKRIWAATYAK